MVATDLQSADMESDQVAPVDVAFESLWEDMDFDLTSLQLV
jgi:hypothetical protein